MMHILECIVLLVQEVKGRDGSMVNRSGVENDEYAKFGPEYGILGRKRAGSVKRRWPGTWPFEWRTTATIQLPRSLPRPTSRNFGIKLQI
jgi:hypothetical protein